MFLGNPSRCNAKIIIIIIKDRHLNGGILSPSPYVVGPASEFKHYILHSPHPGPVYLVYSWKRKTVGRWYDINETNAQSKQSLLDGELLLP